MKLLRERLQSFVYAFQGAATLLRTQPNARIHLIATLAVGSAAAFCRVTAGEWMALTLVTALVWITEALNSALEFLADEVTLERRERIQHAKDMAAFAVLAAAGAAVVVGGIVFLPRILAVL